MPIKEIMIFTEDKVMISVWEIISGPDAPCVIFSHGLRSSKENFLNLAGELYKKGYNCFLFDFRGHGVSRGGSISSFGYKEQKDLEAVINYILGNVFFTNKNIGLFGASMGASVSLITAGKYKQVKVVVVDSAYDNLLDSMLINLKLKYKLPIWLFRYPFRLAYTARFLKDPKNISPEKALETMENKAVFFLNGGKDLKNPAEKAVKMFSLFKGQKKIWVLPEAGHMQAVSLNFEEYKTKVLDFFCKYLNKKIL
jgi:hypothetical protein